MIQITQRTVVASAVFLAVAVILWAGTGLGGNNRKVSKSGSERGSDAAVPWQDFKKPSEGALRDRLDPLQYEVTQQCGTEPPFQNALWDEHREGIYVDVVSGEPLFSSRDKFDSGTGWPSFTRPLDAGSVAENEDKSLGMKRVEVRSQLADSHLGHAFNDGPGPTGLRYCINSAALRFIPVDRLEEEGYGDYLVLFRPNDMKDKAKSEDRGIATFAGGCFWGMEGVLSEIPGVIDTEVGYTGGRGQGPDYEVVSGGRSGHAEAVQVVFDPRILTYEALLGYFFRMHDPTTKNRQGNDVGSQYRSAIFYHDERQREIAERVKEMVNRSGKWKDPVVTEIAPAGSFYKAEEYHQDYLEKHPNGYTCHFLRDWDLTERAAR